MGLSGPKVVVYIVTVILIVLTMMLLSGKCSWLVAGYNTAKKAEQRKYNEKKLSRLIGISLSVIDILFIISCIVWEDVAYRSFNYIFTVVVFLDIVVTVILANILCKEPKRE